MSWVRVPRAEFDRIRKLAADRKAKREEKRKALPWAGKGKPKLVWVPPGMEAAAKRLIESKPRPRRKKSLVEVAWDRNDALWSLAIRSRDSRLYGKRCRVCGKNEGPGVVMVGYHLVPKKRGAIVRWLLENGIQGCSRCNFGERMNPLKYRDKHIALVGLPLMEALEARARTTAQFRLDDLLAIGAWLKAVIEAGAGRLPQPPSCLPPVVV